jgi:hypothetical protein
MKSNPSLKNTYSLDVALAEDFEELVNLVLSVPTTETEHYYDVDIKKVVLGLGKVLQNIDVPIIRDPEGNIVGCLIMTEHSHWWTTETDIVALLMYILPEHRSSQNFKTLLDYGEEYAKIKDKNFIFSLAFVSNLGVKEKLLQRYGYEKISVSMIKKEISDG